VVQIRRLFQNHNVRNYVELEGIWDFMPITDQNILPEKYDYTMPVPGCWEMNEKFLKYSGVAAYRKFISIKKKGNYRLEFKGVCHTANIYLDNNKVGYHYGGYTPFEVIILDLTEGEHELVVTVDNSFSDKSTLHRPNDYYTYGGIIRPVGIESIENVYIDRIQFTPFYENDEWKADIDVFIKNIGSVTEAIDIKGNLDKYELSFGSIEVDGGKSIKVSKCFSFPDIKTWSCSSPNLYLLNINLYREGQSIPADDFIERVGFREIKVTGKKLYLNGEKLFIKGFNRHEDHPMVGSAMPLQIMVKDMDLMQDMGVNSVRTSHYPNDERFLDLCDERGIVVWEESHARGISAEEMRNPLFAKQSEDCIREMLENHYNHPSIIIWGILNECNGGNEETRIHHKNQLQQIKDFDKSRPVTFASCDHYRDLCHDLVDIVSLNVYSGWYNDNPTEKTIDDIMNWVNGAGGKDKPVIVSEFGGGAVYGFRERTRVKWSEERQADIIEDCLKVYLNKEGIVGALIWQFCDCKVTEDSYWFQTRPRTKNNKGIVDEYRRPKLAYDVVKKYFNSKE
jgi:beta-glucuronidase